MAVDGFSILFHLNHLNHKNTFKSIRIFVGILIAARVAARAAGTSLRGRGLTADRKPGTVHLGKVLGNILLLPLVELIETSRLAVDERIDVLGRAKGLVQEKFPSSGSIQNCSPPGRELRWFISPENTGKKQA